MANLNKWLGIGRLTRDPESKYTPSGLAISNFALAVNEYSGKGDDRQERTVFIECTAFQKTADLCNQHLNKGSQVFIEGKLALDQWTSPEGQKRSKLYVIVNNVQFMGAKPDQPARNTYQRSEADYGGGDYEPVEGEYAGPQPAYGGHSNPPEDIPFAPSL